jgi:hypothetical protein
MITLQQLQEQKRILARKLFANGANGKTKGYARRILTLNTRILKRACQKKCRKV